MIKTDPGIRAVYGVGLPPVACWDCGFESPAAAWMSVSCECCVLSGIVPCDGLITYSREYCRACCVEMSVIWKHQQRGSLGPLGLSRRYYKI